ncbi:MFS general substrate transporter [Meredithblackwellia eburnea MCA 4105]
MSFNEKENASFEESHQGSVEDKALNVLMAHSGDAAPTEQEERAVLWKIDRVLMPLMIFVYGLQYLDKIAHGQSTNFGALTDLKLAVVVGKVADISRYRTSASIFWWGYIVGTYPLTVMAMKMPVSKACAAMVVAWGIVFILGAACNSYQGIYAQRFFLGFIESGVTPCFMLLTACFYKKAEQASRTAIWFAACGLAQILGLSIQYGVLSIKMEIAKWRSIYLLWGSVTIVSGILFWFVVPDNLTTAKFLNERERFVAINRLRENQAEVDTNRFNWSQVKESLLDFRIWLLFPLGFLTVVPNAMVSTFQPVVLKGLGYTPMQTILMGMPGGATNMVWMIGMGFLQQRYRNIRCFSYIATILPVMACSVLMWKLPAKNYHGKLACIYIFAIFSSALVTLLAQTTSNVAGRTKRTFANALVITGYAVGNACAPLTYNAKESPAFPSGFKATLGCLAAGIFLMIVYTVSCAMENKRRDALGEEAHKDGAFHDLTDKQNLAFRYQL